MSHYTWPVAGGTMTLLTAPDSPSDSEAQLQSSRQIGVPKYEIGATVTIVPSDAKEMANWLITAVFVGKAAEAYWETTSDLSSGAIEVDGCFDEGIQIVLANHDQAADSREYDAVFFPNTDTDAANVLIELAHALIAWAHGAE